MRFASPAVAASGCHPSLLHGLCLRRGSLQQRPEAVEASRLASRRVTGRPSLSLHLGDGTALAVRDRHEASRADHADRFCSRNQRGVGSPTPRGDCGGFCRSDLAAVDGRCVDNHQRVLDPSRRQCGRAVRGDPDANGRRLAASEQGSGDLRRVGNRSRRRPSGSA